MDEIKTNSVMNIDINKTRMRISEIVKQWVVVLQFTHLSMFIIIAIMCELWAYVSNINPYRIEKLLKSLDNIHKVVGCNIA